MRPIFACIWMAALTCVASGQQFEVVSVKPNHSRSNSSHSQSDQGRLTATNMSLRSLILIAYDLKNYQIEAPDWLNSERYDVVAKFPEALPSQRDQYRAALASMMRTMLADRFKLAAHRDRKTFPVYGLVVAKGGIKFKKVPDAGSHQSTGKNNHYEGKCVTLSAFAEFLARRMDLPVLDMTGLKGFYDLTLDWVPEPRSTAEPKPETPAFADHPSGPTLLEAVQDQLGLKLEPRKAPIEILIVDHAEKVPTEN